MRRAYVSEVTHFAGICSFSVYYRNCAVQPGFLLDKYNIFPTFVDKFWVNVVVTLSLNDIITVSICKKTTKY